MEKEKIVKKMSEILRTDADHIAPAIEKIKKEVELQKKEIKKLGERI